MMEYYSAIKKSEILPFAATQMDLDNMLSGIIQRKTNTMMYLWMWICVYEYKWYHLYMDSKKNNTNECIQLKNSNNRLIDWKDKSAYQRGSKGERGMD